MCLYVCLYTKLLDWHQYIFGSKCICICIYDYVSMCLYVYKSIVNMSICLFVYFLFFNFLKLNFFLIFLFISCFQSNFLFLIMSLYSFLCLKNKTFSFHLTPTILWLLQATKQQKDVRKTTCNSTEFQLNIGTRTMYIWGIYK